VGGYTYRRDPTGLHPRELTGTSARLGRDADERSEPAPVRAVWSRPQDLSDCAYV